jgi:FHA domain-containing protein/type VI secretion system protein
MTADAAELVIRVQSAPEDAVSGGTGECTRFTANGGTVGRSSGCDLTIPDHAHVVSRQHFEVAYEDGGFVAIDTSANGLFYNDSTAPVGQGNRVRLRQGDRLAAGDYKLRVERVATAADSGKTSAAPPEATLSGNPFAEGRYNDSSTAGAPGPPEDRPDLSDFDDDLPGQDGRDAIRRDQFGLPEGEAMDPFRELTSSGSAGWRTGLSARAAPSVNEDENRGPLIPEDYDPLGDLQVGSLDAASTSDPGPQQPDHTPAWRSALSDVIGKPEAPSAGTPAEQTSPGQADEPAASSSNGDVTGTQAALAAFCHGAGIDPNELATDDPAAALERAGAVFSALGHGTADLIQARGAFKQEYRVQRTMLGAAENNPLKFAPDRNTALVHLLQPQARGYMTGVRAVDQAFDDMKQHELALVSAMHRALAHVLDEFEPSNLESRLQGMSLRDVIPGGRRSRYWELYCEHYARIAKSAEDVFEGALGREFVKAYEEATRNK